MRKCKKPREDSSAGGPPPVGPPPVGVQNVLNMNQVPIPPFLQHNSMPQQEQIAYQRALNTLIQYYGMGGVGGVTPLGVFPEPTTGLAAVRGPPMNGNPGAAGLGGVNHGRAMIYPPQAGLAFSNNEQVCMHGPAVSFPSVVV